MSALVVPVLFIVGPVLLAVVVSVAILGVRYMARVG